jgi:hypothetical protein
MKTRCLSLIFTILLLGCTTGQKPAVPVASSASESVSGTVIPDTTKVSVVRVLSAGRTISVGGSGADIRGFTSSAIQTACDAIHLSGGGTVILMPGVYIIEAPVKIFDNMTISGSGKATILRKCKGFRSAFALDADYGELKINVKDPSGFHAGMGVAIYDNDHRSGWDVTTARITAVRNNDVYIDSWLLRDYNSAKGGTLSNACSVIEAVEAQNLKISDLAIEGARESNDIVDGCRVGAIYLHKVKNALVENIRVSDFNCDGISWQITEYVTVRNCEVTGCANAGLHPGTGSPYTVIEKNKCHNNDGYGLFVCWRVRNGIVKDNIFYANGINGICTGHKDVDMLYTGNYIYNNAGDGINLRGETELNAPHRSIFRKNIIENNGTKGGGYGLSVNSMATGVVLEENIFRSNGKGNQLAAVMLMKNSLPVEMKNNKIDNHPKGELVKTND